MRQPEHLGEDDHDRLAVGRDDDGPAPLDGSAVCRQNPRGQVLVRLTAGPGVCRVVPEPAQLLRTLGHEIAHRDAIPVPEALLVPVAVLDRVDPEHAELERAGWAVIQGKAGGGAGMSTDPKNGRRERLWMSPACLHTQETLWGTP